jgi:hypothetical protein
MCAAKSDVRFTPNSDRESGFPHKVMSALPPKADMCGALGDVGFGPKADICAAIRHVCFTAGDSGSRPIGYQPAR